MKSLFSPYAAMRQEIFQIFITRNKNQKNPLMLSVAYGLHAALMALRLKASFHASPDAIIALHAKHRQHQSKKPGFQPKKPRIYHFSFTIYYLADKLTS